MKSTEIKPAIALVNEIKTLIAQSKQQVAITVNDTMSLLYWQIGKRINKEVLKDKRAEYGKQIVNALSTQLISEYGSGWSAKHLRHCLRFAETIADEQIVYALRRQLSWTHIRSLIYIDEPLKRDFYIEMCKLERWSTRTLLDRLHKAISIAQNNLSAHE